MRVRFTFVCMFLQLNCPNDDCMYMYSGVIEGRKAATSTIFTLTDVIVYDAAMI